MPAISKNQRKAAGIAYSKKCKNKKGAKLKGSSKSMSNMSCKQLRKYAKTKEDDLPKQANEGTDMKNLMVNFINDICEKEYSSAKERLSSIVELKIKERIKEVDEKLTK